MTAHRMGPLFTDLYELTMAAGYHARSLFEDATFSLFIRNHSAARNYFVAAGLEDILTELEALRFSDDDLSYLDRKALFTRDFLDYLQRFRFTGNLVAMPEGTIFFPDEPILEITAPLIEAQVVETLVLNTIGFQTLIATKAARCVHAASGRALIDFSSRRTQGYDAALKVARSTFIAGFAGTSNVLAGKVYGIPISGTMAHSYVTAFPSELEAFLAYSETFPEHTVLLIDTYDTIGGARNAVKTAEAMRDRGKSLVGVRLDSGDMTTLSGEVRRILNDAGFPDVKIFASSGFDEFKITEAVAGGARIDAFGVGTKVGVSADMPYFDIVYKMVRFKDRDVRKLSAGKTTLAGEKQVFRKFDAGGLCRSDIIGLRDDRFEDRTPMLRKVMAHGKRRMPPVAVQDLQSRFKTNFTRLPDLYKDIREPRVFPVELSPQLAARQQGL